METSRLTRYSKTTYPKRKRTIRVQGSFEDSNKWIRCWNCGFLINTDRDLGDPEHSGCYQTDPIVPATSPTGSGNSTFMNLERVDTVGIMIINGLDGDPVTDYYTARSPLVNKGCPFCGTTNLL